MITTNLPFIPSFENIHDVIAELSRIREGYCR